MRDARLHPVIPSGDHHPIRGGDDGLQMVGGLDLLNLRHHASRAGWAGEQLAQREDVVGVAHERQRDEIRVALGGKRDVRAILVGDGRQARLRVRDVHALARRHRSRDASHRPHARPVHVEHRQARRAVADDHLGAVREQLRQVAVRDRERVRVLARLPSDGQKHLFAFVQGALADGTVQADFRSLEVEQDRHETSGYGGGLADLAAAAAQLLRRAVRAVQAGTVHARVDELPESPVGGRPERGDNLRSTSWSIAPSRARRGLRCRSGCAHTPLSDRAGRS